MKKKSEFLFKNKIKAFLAILMLSTLILTGCGQSQIKVHVDGIEISKKNLYLAEGQTAVISAQVYPFNASNQDYSFESSNSSIVTIEDGFVTAKRAGDAVIYVYSSEGGYKDECNVLVTTASDNLELNDYNNLNMPAKEMEPIYYGEVAQKNNEYKTKNIFNKQPFNKNSKIYGLQNVNLKNKHEKSLSSTSNKTFSQQIKEGIKKVNAEVSEDIEAGKNVLEDVKNGIKNSINALEEQKQSLNKLYENVFINTQDSFMQSIKNLQTEILDSMKNIQKSMIDDLESAKEKIENGELTTETGDMNGVTFVVISNNANENSDKAI